MNRHPPSQASLAVAALGIVIILLGAATPARAAVVTPAHVHQDVMIVHADLELIRLEMGRPPGKKALLQVENAAPREVFFQALTLFRKANRLAFEHTRKKVEDPPIPSGVIQAQDVRKMVQRAGERLGLVMHALGIEEKSPVPPLAEGVTPTQVFAAIVDANRAVNGLLEQRFAPADVFEQVTVAIAYTARLLEATGRVDSPPEPPEYANRKQPADVYRLLLACFEKIRQVAGISRVPMLNLVETEQQIEDAEPSDVYDLAALLVAELSFFYEQLPGLTPPRGAYNPGRKLPSHVYQRAGILMKQLDTLIERAQLNPRWLGVQNEPPPAQP